MKNDLSALQPGHIVWCAFPYARDGKTVFDEAEKIRPCLVLDATDDEVWVAEGTSQKVDRFDLGEFIIPANAITGLKKPSKIRMQSTAWLPRTSDYFPLHPIIGDLQEGQLKAVGRAGKEAGII